MNTHDYQISYRYRPCAFTERRDESWPPFNASATEIADEQSHASKMSTMQRYLHEPDRHLYETHMDEDDVTMHPFPSVPSNSWKYLGTEPSFYAHSRRLPSPSDSGPSSSYAGSTWSDRQSTPWSSPDMSGPYSPQSSYRDSLVSDAGGHYGSDHYRQSGPCVAMHDVQRYADAQPENVPYDEDQAAYCAYGSYAQEGYQPIQSNGYDVVHTAIVPSQATSEINGYARQSDAASPTIRRRRATMLRSVTSPYLPSKVIKRPSTGRRTSSCQATESPEASPQDLASTNRSFPCPLAPYGCTSTFASKNEWKRHVNTQHLRLGFWRCDQCPQANKKPNDFNRKDLFTQHVRRMHPVDGSDLTAASKHRRTKASKCDAVEEALTEASTRCYRRLRSPPEQSRCVVCDQTFNGAGTWDERMEHIGRHMEAAKKDGLDTIDPCNWKVDQSTEAWLASERLIVRSKGRWVLAEGKP